MVVSLGCAKNLVDSETLAPQLIRLGYTMTTEPQDASVIVVNTCGFLEGAVSEAIETILDLSRWKEAGVCRRLIATGCMVQRYGKKLPALLPEVDLFLGTGHYHELASALQSLEEGIGGKLRISRPLQIMDADTPRLRATPHYTAYVKIAEGCCNHCTFCLIPHLRGPYRSRRPEDVLREVAQLGETGVVEINLIAQDITAYGRDRDNPHGLVELLELLENVDGIEWIRLLYAYPHRVDEKLLRTMRESKKITPYLDIPVQHCATGVLRAMHRDKTIPDMRRIIDQIRSFVPDIALRTSLMVGFPGESEEDFEELMRFVEDMRFDHLGVFAYSPETGSRAAAMRNQTPVEVKDERKARLMELQQEISRGKLQGLVGKVLPVLIEGPHPETDLLLSGRLPIQAPEVDGGVIVTRGNATVGMILPARITAAHDYDVEAELEPETPDAGE
jgi:ribosomal protein S12 methylthiotransferase